MYPCMKEDLSMACEYAKKETRLHGPMSSSLKERGKSGWNDGLRSVCKGTFEEQYE